MDKWTRLRAAIAQEPVDRPPIALWRHFPHDDQDADRLAACVVAFQRQYDFDLVKVTPAGGYSAEMYGGVLAADPDLVDGARRHVSRVVNAPEDWEQVEALDIANPVFVRERRAVRLIRCALGPDQPIAQTVFTPLSIASRLAGPRFWADLREHPDLVRGALEQITVTATRFALAAIEAGADALFVATQVATPAALTLPELRAFAEPYDRALLEQVMGEVDLVVLHLHGEGVYFDEMATYPVHALNWHDRSAGPTLAAGRQRFAGAVAGGIGDRLLAEGTPEQVAAQVQEAVAQVEGRGLIVAANCVAWVKTPADNLHAARAAVEPRTG